MISKIRASLETANCMEEAFKKCATPTHRELFKFFNDHFMKSMSAFCESKEQIQKFTAESTCIVDKVKESFSFLNFIIILFVVNFKGS